MTTCQISGLLDQAMQDRAEHILKYLKKSLVAILQLTCSCWNENRKDPSNKSQIVIRPALSQLERIISGVISCSAVRGKADSTQCGISPALWDTIHHVLIVALMVLRKKCDPWYCSVGEWHWEVTLAEMSELHFQFGAWLFAKLDSTSI